jgi:iron complex outermembrane receptor protein
MSLPAGCDGPPLEQVRARSRHVRNGWGGIYLALLITLPAVSWAAETRLAGTTILELKQLSLEELMGVDVTSVSKKEEKLFDAAAAIYVITEEDIRRSGATSIPEVLRNVPGVEVARVDSHTWAITVRGFNSTAANKLLVLIDGRSVYTPLFSGVFWDVQDTLLEDVERIEVIRGPGATLWGANAVNGVINIITKSAKQTEGLLVTGGGGTEERGFGGVRYGGKLSETARYRFYAKYFNRDDTVLPDGTDAGDAWQMGQGGFRIDWDASDKNRLTFQGDLYGGSLGQTSTIVSPTPPFRRLNNADTTVAGGNALGRWVHHFSEASDVQLQVYYDRTERRIPLVFSEQRDTFDVDVQHRFPVGQWQDIVWGVGYRFTQDSVGNTFNVSWDPDRRATHLVSIFVQDDITLVPNRLRLTLGSKFEHNDFTGFEIQPNARLAWTPTERQTVWAAVSRAVRIPTRLDHDIRLNAQVIPGTPPTALAVFGSRNFVSEELLAYELGYRLQPHPRLSLDVAAFYNVYDRLLSIEGPGPAQPSPPAVVIPFVLANNLEGETYGVEAWANYQIADWWRWQAGYTYLHMQLRSKPGSSDTTSVAGQEGSSPQHRFFLRSWLDLPANLELDTTLRYVDGLSSQRVRAYVALDVHLGWRPIKNLELAVVGQNLLDNRHREFSSTLRTEIQRGIYGKVTWRY